MLMTRFAVVGFCFCSLAGSATGQVIFSDDFDTDTSANWNVGVSGADTEVTFGFDYGSMGIPEAPNSNGSKFGVRFAVNMDFPTGGEAITVSPVGLNVSGSYQLRFDMWINANGPFPDGGGGSTEFVTCGIGYDDVTVNNGTVGGSGAWFGVTGEGGATRDYRAYMDGFEQFAETGAFFAGTSSASGGAHNAPDPYYAGFGGIDVAAVVPSQTSAHPSQVGTTQEGAVGFGWHVVTVTVTGSTVLWEIDGLPIAELDANDGPGFSTTGNISIGYMDLFASVSDNAAVTFGLIDNVEVCTNVCAALPTGACCMGDGSCTAVGELECVATGGVYQGDGVDCGGVVCPITIGACCYGNGLCDDTLDESECTESLGTFQVGQDCGACVQTITGPDVVYFNTQDIANWGEVGGIRGYSLGSWVCNIGDEDLRWGNAWNGTPILATNAYRLHEGRLMQIGMSWAKHSCCVTNVYPGCGICNGVNGQFLGAGCRDIYSANYNGRQDRMGPRSAIDPYTGTVPGPATGAVGDAIFKRIQIQETDLVQEPNGALYFVEGVFVGDGDADSGNAMNNASYRHVTMEETSFDMVPTGPMYVADAAIYAWRDHGNGIGQPDLTVELAHADVPDEGRFTLASKVVDNGDGTWRYEYAAFNLNSTRAGGSFEVGFPIGTTISNVGFHDVDSHSGEVYDSTDWSASVLADSVLWSSPETHDVNANSNALRWGMMYNFWFDADAPPQSGNVTLGLFIPGTPSEVSVTLPVPTTCLCELDGAPGVTISDLLGYLSLWFANHPDAELNDDGVVNVVDLLAFLSCWFDVSGICN